MLRNCARSLCIKNKCARVLHAARITSEDSLQITDVGKSHLHAWCFTFAVHSINRCIDQSMHPDDGDEAAGGDDDGVGDDDMGNDNDGEDEDEDG